MNQWLVASGKWLRWRPWQWYWVLWKFFDVVAWCALNIQEPAIERAIQYATSCYVTGGPRSSFEYLKAIAPDKSESIT